MSKDSLKNYWNAQENLKKGKSKNYQPESAYLGGNRGDCAQSHHTRIVRSPDQLASCVTHECEKLTVGHHNKTIDQCVVGGHKRQRIHHHRAYSVTGNTYGSCHCMLKGLLSLATFHLCLRWMRCRLYHPTSYVVTPLSGLACSISRAHAGGFLIEQSPASSG